MSDGKNSFATTDATPTDATPTDATPTDATPTDATPTDATPTDATPTDATPTDATPTDATPQVDNTGTPATPPDAPIPSKPPAQSKPQSAEVTQVVEDAKSDARALIEGAKAYGIAFINAVDAKTETQLPDVEQAALHVFYSVIPEGGRGLVQGIIGGFAQNALGAVNTAVLSESKKWAGLALLRLDAISTSVEAKL